MNRTSATDASRTTAREIPPAGSDRKHEQTPRHSNIRDLCSLKSGDVVAERYSVVDRLGQGGMGVVYRCHDQNSGEHVALKRVSVPPGKRGRRHIDWFRTEAQALASLAHPNIVSARDFGLLSDGTPYLAMDLVQGQSLHEYAHAQLSFPIIWSLTDQVLSALSHAHARGIVHGDLKPSNILLREARGGPPLVYVLDFGLAWQRQTPHDARLDGHTPGAFVPHAGAGTPGYMSPEQAKHEAHHVCGASDLYALGCILYKLLSGKPPFVGSSSELQEAHAFEPPPALEPRIKLPSGVLEFVMRCLEKSPWDRFEFVAEARRSWARFEPTSYGADVWRLPRLRRHAADVGTRPAPYADSQSTPRDLLMPSPQSPGRQACGLLGLRRCPMVGRWELRSRLLAACREAMTKPTSPHRVVLLAGKPGVGKSRLAEWLAEVVHEEGEMVPLVARYGHSHSEETGVRGAISRYYNFQNLDRHTIERSLMQRWRVSPGDAALRTWVAATAAWLQPREPEPPTMKHGRVVTPPGPSGVQLNLRPELRSLVEHFALGKLARGRGIVLVLDNLHAASLEDFDAIRRLRQLSPDQRVLIVATVRSQQPHRDSASRHLLRMCESLNGEVIEVEPLDHKTMCSLLRAALPLHPRAVQEAARRSQGYPLKGLQQLHEWAKQRQLQVDNGIFTVPHAILNSEPMTNRVSHAPR